jgi:hypothetical protein
MSTDADNGGENEDYSTRRLNDASRLLDAIGKIPRWNADQIIAILILLELSDLNDSMKDMSQTIKCRNFNP